MIVSRKPTTNDVLGRDIENGPMDYDLKNRMIAFEIKLERDQRLVI